MSRYFKGPVVLVARLILGGVFIYASFDKITNPAAFAALIKVLKTPAFDATSTISCFPCDIADALVVTKKLAIAKLKNNFFIITFIIRV